MFTRGIIGHLFLPIEGERLDKIQDSRFHSSHKKRPDHKTKIHIHDEDDALFYLGIWNIYSCVHLFTYILKNE